MIDPSLFWKQLLTKVVESKCTDIHFSGSKILLRINMGIIPYCELNNDYEKILTFLAEDTHLKTLQEKGESDFAASHEGHRLRCNLYKSIKGICGAFRPLPNKSFPWEKMGLSSEIMKVTTQSNQGLIIITGPTGSGKSLGYGTPIIKYDGSIVPIESIKIGDLLMGPDSKPRTVTQTQPGMGKMYKIIPKTGQPWFCNSDHILTLRKTIPPRSATQLSHLSTNPSHKEGAGHIQETIDIPIETFLKNKNDGQQWKLFHGGPGESKTPDFEFSIEEAGHGPYFGILLDGDGRFLLGDFTVTHNSTTLCSILDYINSKYCHKIITIEDPIEYIFEDKKSIVDQREIGPHTHGFHEALRVALRQNPNVIFVGEIRDYATALTALHAAETGHLVFTTLHTKRVSNTVSRIIEMAPDGNREEIRTVIANNVICIMCQRLLPKKDKSGIIPCREILVMNPAAANHIKEGKEKSLPSIMNANREWGMLDWDSALNRLFANDEISKETYEANQDKSDKIP